MRNFLERRKAGHLLYPPTTCSTPMPRTRLWARVYCLHTAAKDLDTNIVGFSFLRVLQENQRADERTRTAYPCSSYEFACVRSSPYRCVRELPLFRRLSTIWRLPIVHCVSARLQYMRSGLFVLWMRRRGRRLLHFWDCSGPWCALGGGSQSQRGVRWVPRLSHQIVVQRVEVSFVSQLCRELHSSSILRLLFASSLVKALSIALRLRRSAWERREHTRRRTAQAAAYSFVSPPPSPQRSPPCRAQSKVLPGHWG
jgi:hypothetical protein